MRRILAVVLVLLSMVLTRAAASQSPLPGRDVATGVEPDTSLRVADYVVAGTLLLGAGTSFALVPQRESGLEGGVLFDDGVRDGVALGSRGGRDRAVLVSDATYYLSMAYPALVDPAIAAARGPRGAAWQMTVINAQSFALTGLVSVLTERLFGRVRPFAGECAADGDYDPDCGDPTIEHQSFMSGHTAMAFTGAGLTCAHHQRLSLYGGGAGDVIACVSALAAATTTGVTRMMADRHYATDVLAGAAVGIASGYLLPTLFHPARPRGASESAQRGPAIAVGPMVGGGTVGLTASGVL